MAGHAVYQIIDWRKTYENAESRKYKNCKFVCVPNNQDKEGFVRILAEPDGVALYGIWCLILGAVSHHRGRDGWLTANGSPGGKPWTAEYLAIRWRCSTDLVTKALELLSSKSVGWMRVVEHQETAGELWETPGESSSVVGEHRETLGECRQVLGDKEPELELEPELEGEEGPSQKTASSPRPRHGSFQDLGELQKTAETVYGMLVSNAVGAKGSKRIAPSKADELTRRWLVSWKDRRKPAEVVAVLKYCSEWLSDHEPQRSATTRGAADRLNRAVRDGWGLGQQQANGNGKDASSRVSDEIRVREAWKAVSGFFINRIKSRKLFKRGVLGECPHQDRAKLLLQALGGNEETIERRLERDDKWEWTVKQEADVLAEREIARV